MNEELDEELDYIDLVPHCENPECDLGSAQFTCPVCFKHQKKFDDVWWLAYESNNINTECDNCKAKLVAYWDQHYGYKIKVKI